MSPEPVNAERDRAASEAQTPDRCCMPRQGETKPRSRDRSRGRVSRHSSYRTHHAAPDVRVHSGQCRPCASVVDETVPALTLAARITTITSDGREGLGLRCIAGTRPHRTSARWRAALLVTFTLSHSVSGVAGYASKCASPWSRYVPWMKASEPHCTRIGGSKPAQNRSSLARRCGTNTPCHDCISGAFKW